MANSSPLLADSKHSKLWLGLNRSRWQLYNRNPCDCEVGVSGGFDRNQHTTATDAQLFGLPINRSLGLTVDHRFSPCALGYQQSRCGECAFDPQGMSTKSFSNVKWPIFGCRTCRSAGGDSGEPDFPNASEARSAVASNRRFDDDKSRILGARGQGFIANQGSRWP